MMIEVSKPPEYASTAFFTCCFIVILQDRNQNSFLGGQAVGGLMKRPRIVGIEAGVRHFKSAMRGQTMHKVSFPAGLCHQLVVDLIGTKDTAALFCFFFLTH